jgi:hypothetical protein
MGVRRSVTGLLAGTLGCLVALVLGGCGGDDSVADPPVSPTTSSPTQAPHRESAEHFIRRWAAADIQMQNTGHTSQFRRLSQPCHDCLKLADRVDKIYRAGGYVHTDGWSIGQVRVVSRDGDHLLVDLHVVSRPTEYRNSASGPTKSFPGGPATYQLGIEKTASSWIVTSLGQLAS